jgi:hypothetical protein
MRKSLSVLILVVGVVLGYSMRPVPAIAQAGDFQPFMPYPLLPSCLSPDSSLSTL